MCQFILSRAFILKIMIRFQVTCHLCTVHCFTPTNDLFPTVGLKTSEQLLQEITVNH